MIARLLRNMIKKAALDHGAFRSLYVKLCRPSSEEYTEYVKKWGGLHAMGENCAISPWATITDPSYVAFGNNVALAQCTLLGHDGVIRMLNVAFGKKLDSVGKIVIRDNCFIGHGAIIMPGVTIGPNAIVAAGSVVTKDVPENTVVSGIPAKEVGRTDVLAYWLEARSVNYPWYDLIQARHGAWDPDLEQELVARRVKYFFAESTP